MEEALRQAEQAAPDLALVNVELPGTNGIETARALRRRHPASHVVLMSANDSDALRIAAIDAGAVAFIRKRELTSSLLPIVSRVLSGKPLPQVAE